MSTHKTAELTGPLLDAAVALAEGLEFRIEWYMTRLPKPGIVWVRSEHSGVSDAFPNLPYKPSTDWSQGGPIIAREFISLRAAKGEWLGEATRSKKPATGWAYDPLIAAMRAYVVSKFGDTVALPDLSR